MRANKNRRRRLTTASALTLALACVLLAPGCRNGDEKDVVEVVVTEGKGEAGISDPRAIIEAAKVDGELHWYTSAPEGAAEAFLEAFEEKHPYINTHLRRSSTFDIVSQIQHEIEGGDVRADVFHVLDVGAFIDLRRNGELLQYQSHEESAIREDFRQPGYWWAMRVVALGMAYNPERLPADQAPKTWEDLLQPELRGKIGLKDAATAGTAYAEYFLLRQRLGTIFWERMAQQRPRISRSAKEVMAGLESGEILVAGEMAGYAILDAQGKGESVVGIWPKEGVPFTPGPVAILARSPHPNAAKLFIDYALSKEGQERFRELVSAYSARMDVEPLEGQPPLNSLNLLAPTGGWEEYLQKQPALRAEFESLFHPEGE